MHLKTTVVTKLNDTLRMCASCAGSKILEDAVREMLTRLNEPLRVAVVGVMKAGKSTLLNSIMKEKILKTGTLETTYTVSWFKYAPKSGLRIIFKDGTNQEAPFEDLEKWTVRDPEKRNPLIEEVKHVEILYPSEVLKVMELVDTPGLWSAYEKDSNNTLEYMALKKAADKATKEEASAADAIIYAFSRGGVQQNDAEILESFQGDGVTANTSPINALGVYTKADLLWQFNADEDPFAAARSIAGSLMENPHMKKLLYTISTVSAMMVESVSDINSSDWNTLNKLSKLDQPLLLELLSDISCFMECEADEIEDLMGISFDKQTRLNICSADERSSVCNKLGQYGIFEIIKALLADIDKEQIVEYLYEKSNIKNISELICQHFGNRSFAIKLQFIFSRLFSVCSHIINENDDPLLHEICENLKEEIHQIQDTEQVFKELKVLQNYYNGLLKLKNEEEIKQLLQITGEFGSFCEARLGTVCGNSIKELSEIAARRIGYWNARANDIPVTRYYEEAANVLSRSCDIMYYHLRSLMENN